MLRISNSQHISWIYLHYEVKSCLFWSAVHFTYERIHGRSRYFIKWFHLQTYFMALCLFTLSQWIFHDIMTFTLFQKTEEIEFSRVCLHFLSSAHTSDGPISNRAFSQDNWTLYPSLTHFNNMRRDIPTTRAHSIISHISYSEINLLLHYAVQFWSRPLFLQTGSPGRWCWYSLQTSTS